MAYNVVKVKAMDEEVYEEDLSRVEASQTAKQLSTECIGMPVYVTDQEDGDYVEIWLRGKKIDVPKVSELH